MQTSFASASRCPSCVRSSLKTRSSTSFLLTPPHLQPHSLQTLLSSRHRQIVALPACKAAPSQLASSVSLAVPAVSTLVTAITAPAAAWAGETPSATAAADQAVQDLPTVTFGGSLGQWDPVIGVTFYLVVGALTILTLGVRCSRRECAATAFEQHIDTALDGRFCICH